MAKLRAALTVPAELEAAIDWYGARSPQVAQRFVAAVDAAFDAIAAAPESFPWWNQRYRYARVRKFPYIIPFRIDADVIWIAGVRHTSRSNLDLDA